MSGIEAHPMMSWQEIRTHAESRPRMYIGSQESGHKSAISDVLRLVWQAKVFRRPQVVRIDLSPTQYVVRAECGPLIRPVQQIFSVGTGETIAQTWGREGQAYFGRILREDEEKGIPFSHQRHRRGWRYCFSGPTGPRLASPTNPFIFAHDALWGIRTNSGLWCESYQEGIPTGKPFLLSDPSLVGLLSVAALDPQWFTGLPFTEEDAHHIARLSHGRYSGGSQYAPRPLYTCGAITASWHPQDDLVSGRTLTREGLRELLQEPPRATG